MDRTAKQTALFFGFLAAGMAHVSAEAAPQAVSAPTQQQSGAGDTRPDAKSDLRSRRITKMALDAGATPRTYRVKRGPAGEA